MTRETLLALAAKVEALAGPCRETDERIGMAIGLKRTIRVGHECLGNERDVPINCPAYTSSLDAAMKLVPDGYDWVIGRTNDGLTIHAEVGGRGDEFMRFGNNPALALTAAALRARAEMLS